MLTEEMRKDLVPNMTKGETKDLSMTGASQPVVKHTRMYGFIDNTHNSIRGECEHKCRYCYVDGFRHRFGQDPTLRLVEAELHKKLGKDKFWFIGSSTDMWAKKVPSEWITRVLDHLAEYPENSYLLQSKNPARFLEFIDHPLVKSKNMVLCTTLESDIDHEEVSQAPPICERVAAMQVLSSQGFRTMITIEPIMEFSSAANFAEMIASCNPIQVNIGQNTARDVKLPEPTKDQYAELETELTKHGLKIFRKSNLDRMI